MRNLLPVLYACILVLASCKKEPLVYKVNDHSSFVTSSLAYLNTNLAREDYAKLDLQKVNVLKYQGNAIGVQ
ncbi:MAG: hypothetical protein M3015_02780, partial [Bacteroidota bacterium]|nr:hypothetical protein [Bacteroidota bacterium]